MTSPAADRICSISGSSELRLSLPAIQVPAVDSLTDTGSSRRNPRDPGGGTPGGPKSEIRGVPRRQQQQRKGPSRKTRHKRTVKTDSVVPSKDALDDESRMALRSSNYDWTRIIPDSQIKEFHSYPAAAFYAIPGYQDLDPYAGFRNSDYGTQENGHSYLLYHHPHLAMGHHHHPHGTPGIGPELPVVQGGSTLMGETGPAAEKLKQMAANHQLKESNTSGYGGGETNWFFDEYSPYQYVDATPYRLSAGQYSDAAPYVLPAPYSDGLGTGEREFVAEAATFRATKPLSHFPVSGVNYGEHGVQGFLPGGYHGDELDPTGQNQLLANQDAANYVRRSTNQRQAITNADVIVDNDARHRTDMMTQQIQRRAFDSEVGKQGDSLSSNDVMVSVNKTVAESLSDKDRSGSEVKSPHASPPFLAVSSTATSYRVRNGVETAGPVGPSHPDGRLRNIRSSCHLYHVLETHSDTNGKNTDFPDLATRRTSVLPGTSLESSSSSESEFLTETRKRSLSTSGPPQSSFNGVRLVDHDPTHWSVACPQGPSPTGLCVTVDPNGPPPRVHWSKYHPPPTSPSFHFFTVENSQASPLSSSSSSREGPVPGGGHRWAQQSTDAGETMTPSQHHQRLPSCKYGTAAGGAAVAGTAGVAAAGVTQNGGGVQLFIYKDEDSPMELNFIDDLLSTAG